MAVTAKFAADFSDFQSAVSKAVVSLRGFETGAGKVESSLNKMANSLSGTRLIQDAALMAQAIEKVGGTSKLTEQELARVSAQATEAANKLRALGQDVPPGIQKIADAAKNITPALSSADKAAGLLKSSFAQFTLAGLATNAISSLTSALFEFASVGINKLPAVEESFVRLTKAIDVDGSDMLSKMNTATRGMVANYDLMLSANKAMLLGLPVTAESMGDLAKTATTLGKAMGLDATQALDNLIVALGRSSPLILDNLGLTVKVEEANERYAAQLGKTAAELTGAETKMAFYSAAMEAARRRTEELGTQTMTLSDIAKSAWARIGDEVSRQASRINSVTVQMASEFADMVRLMETVRGKLGNLPTPANKAGSNVGAPVQLPKLSVSELLAIGDALDKERVAITGVNRAMKESVPITAEMQHALDLLELAHRHQESALKFQESSWRAWEGTVSKALGNVAKNSAPLHLVTRDLSSFTAQVDASYNGMQVHGELMEQVPAKVKPATDSIGDLSRAMAQLSTVANGSLGAVFQGLSAIVGALDTAKKSATSFKDGLSAFKAGDFLSSLAGMSTGILGIASAAIAAGKAIAGLFDRNKGRDLVVDFAETFGGFDQLHVQLSALGAEGEKLWIALTQGVGRNNPKEAQAAIDAITKALEKKKDASDEAVVMSEAEAQATIETAAEAAKALDDVNERLKVNRDAWGEWSEDVTGYLQRLADDIRSMPLPTPTGASGAASGGGTSGARYTGSATSGRSAAAITQVFIGNEQLDARTVRVVKQKLPAALGLAGR